MKRRVLTLLSLILAVGGLMAQDATIGFSAGASSYYGELNQIPYRSPSYVLGFRYRNNLNERSTFRFNASYANLRANSKTTLDPYQQTLEQSFSTNVAELGLAFEYNFFDFDKSRQKYFLYTPYLVGGTSLLVVPDPYHTFNFSFPIGAGVKIALSEKVSVGVEATYHWTYTDFIDKIRPDDYSSLQHSYNPTPDSFSFIEVFFNYQIVRYKFSCPAYPFQ